MTIISSLSWSYIFIYIYLYLSILYICVCVCICIHIYIKVTKCLLLTEKLHGYTSRMHEKDTDLSDTDIWADLSDTDIWAVIPYIPSP